MTKFLISFSLLIILGLLYSVLNTRSGDMYLDLKEKNEIPENLEILKNSDQEVEVKNLLIYYFINPHDSLYIEKPKGHYYLQREGKWFSAKLKTKKTMVDIILNLATGLSFLFFIYSLFFLFKRDQGHSFQ